MVDIDKLKETCKQIVQEGDLDTLTNKVVRRSAEQKLGLDEKELDQKPYKDLVKTTVEQVLKELENKTQNEVEEDDRMNTEEPEANADDKESDVESAADDGSESHDSDDEEEFSNDIGEEPATNKKKKRSSEESPQKAPKRSKTANVSKASDTTIANLKSYIGKCGVRKVWSKELAEMNTAQQVQHLKSMLADLGMVGRPTLEKCKKIKAKRDLQAELDAINAENIIGENEPTSRSARSRRSAAKNVSYNVDHVSDSEEEEGAAQGSLDEDEEGEESDFVADSDNKEGALDAVEEPASEEDSEFAADSDNDKKEDAQDVAEESAFEEDSD
ncbi:hypothetical protein LPJ78_003329 [Coemansia sp. RSA 989]|nr:hypothetical protein LPJ78_003329 [Coemansia sp. RSA 989]KAJ1871989.1 hypothetical protein LPJ55_003438 [Coemansia sp. RSA 990]